MFGFCAKYVGFCATNVVFCVENVVFCVENVVFCVENDGLCSDALGLEDVSEADLQPVVGSFMVAAKAVHAARGASDAAAKEAEILGELEACEDEEAKAKLAAQAGMLAHNREQAQTIAASKQSEREASAVSAVVDWPMFVTLMAHKMGNDTAFVLAYSTIMLNTDAHNPRLTGQARICITFAFRVMNCCI